MTKQFFNFKYDKMLLTNDKSTVGVRSMTKRFPNFTDDKNAVWPTINLGMNCDKISHRPMAKMRVY